MTNPYLKRVAKGKVAHGNKSEKRLANKMGSRLTPASGAMRGAKSDALLNKKEMKFRIESKSTINNSLSIELGWLVKITEEALQTGCNPVLTFSYVDGDGRAKPKGDWVAMPLWLFQELTEE